MFTRGSSAVPSPELRLLVVGLSALISLLVRLAIAAPLELATGRGACLALDRRGHVARTRPAAGARPAYAAEGHQGALTLMTPTTRCVTQSMDAAGRPGPRSGFGRTGVLIVERGRATASRAARRERR